LVSLEDFAFPELAGGRIINLSIRKKLVLDHTTVDLVHQGRTNQHYNAILMDGWMMMDDNAWMDDG
jgi:hypothetical protein